jgi:hypothetical protein
MATFGVNDLRYPHLFDWDQKGGDPSESTTQNTSFVSLFSRIE